MTVFLCIVFSLAAGISDGACDAKSCEEGREQIAVRDTVPQFRYNLGMASGYARFKTSTQEAERYASLSLLPEMHYGMLGVGLLATIHVDPETRDVREEDFDSVRDYLALVHFVQYGTEENPGGYARLGSIDEVSLGEGLFLDQYSTSNRIDDPMRGVSAEVASEHLSLEGVYSDVVAPGVAGLYVGYYPFGTAPTAVFSRMSFGLGTASDLSDDGDLVNPVRPGAPFLLSPPPDSVTTDVPVGREDGPLFMVGMDASVRWIETEVVTIATYAEGGKIIEYGVGATLGARGRVEVGGVRVQGQYAQRFLGKEFLPDYFNSSFEAQRIRSVSLPVNEDIDGEAVNTRRNELAGRTTSALGHQIQVGAEVEDVFETTVSYETIWEELNAGRFHLDLEVYAPVLPVFVRLGYDRFDLQSLSNLLDVSRDNSLYQFGLAYEVIEPLRLGVELSQTFEPVYQGGRVVGQEKQNRVEPYVRLVLQL